LLYVTHVVTETSKFVPGSRKHVREESQELKRVKPADQGAVFSREEVEQIVQRAVAAAEERLRSEYDKILAEKLAEQFESFTTFNQAYISRQLKESEFSYMS